MGSALTLKQLVQIVPIDEKIKEKVFKEEQSLTKTQKYQIAQICWNLLSAIFESRMREKKEKMLKEIADGTYEYTQEDFIRAEDKVIADFLIKLDEAQTEEKVGQVKTELQKHLRKPTPEKPT